jgi:vacuole morphology and inheritance protein 14
VFSLHRNWRLTKFGADDEIQQSVALKWLYEFLTFAQDVVVPFTPRLIPAVLPNLAHHAPDIQAAAIKTNQLLFTTIQHLPSPSSTNDQSIPATGRSLSLVTASPVRSGIPMPLNTTAANTVPSSSPQPPSPTISRAPPLADAIDGTNATFPNKLRSIVEQPPGVSSSKSSFDRDGAAAVQEQASSRPSSPPPDLERRVTASATNEEAELFDYHATVSALTIKFLSEHEETRVAALKWLIMLHQKVPNKVSII